VAAWEGDGVSVTFPIEMGKRCVTNDRVIETYGKLRIVSDD